MLAVINQIKILVLSMVAEDLYCFKAHKMLRMMIIPTHIGAAEISERAWGVFSTMPVPAYLTFSPNSSILVSRKLCRNSKMIVGRYKTMRLPINIRIDATRFCFDR